MSTRSDSSPLSIQDMTVAYQRRPVLWDVDYEAPSGKLIAIVGPNGAGKSTLIKAVLELIPTASGDVAFFGRPYTNNAVVSGTCLSEPALTGTFRSMPWASLQWACTAKSAGFGR